MDNLTNEEEPVKPLVKKGPIFVPKSSGLGWTLNFERWESYVILGIVLLIIIYKLVQPSAEKK
jgi:hypothetical protein